MMSVLVAAPLRDQDPYFHRWVSCYQALQYPDKLACIASETQACRTYVRHHFPFIQVLGFEVWRPPFTDERIYAITQARETIRRYVCEDPKIAWLLFIDMDLNYPPDTIERMLQWARHGFDLVFSRTPGLISLMHRDVCQSVSFVTGVNFRHPSSNLEEHFQVERQIEVYNSLRPGHVFFKTQLFVAKWLQHQNKPIGVY